MATSFRIIAYKGRTRDFTISLFQSDGTTAVTIDSGDVVRLKIFRGDGATPDLDLDSVGATASGSVLSYTNGQSQFNARIAQGDTSSLAPGAYDAEVNLVDSSESGPSNAIKHAQTGVLHVMAAAGGDIGVA